MKNNHNLVNKTLVFGIMVLFIGMSIVPVVNSLQSLNVLRTSKVNENLELDNSIYVQPNKKLTQIHLSYLKRALPFIRDFETKQAFKGIIAEIMEDGDATSDEIKVIIESNNVGVSKVYILARVKTTDKTDGDLFCIPGFIRSIYGFFAKGVYASYEWWNTSSEPQATTHGWHLTVNNQPVSEGSGKIFGYFGYANFFAMSDPHCPEFYFKLNGFGVLIFHHNL